MTAIKELKRLFFTVQLVATWMISIDQIWTQVGSKFTSLHVQVELKPGFNKKRCIQLPVWTLGLSSFRLCFNKGTTPHSKWCLIWFHTWQKAVLLRRIPRLPKHNPAQMLQQGQCLTYWCFRAPTMRIVRINISIKPPGKTVRSTSFKKSHSWSINSLLKFEVISDLHPTSHRHVRVEIWWRSCSHWTKIDRIWDFKTLKGMK